MVSVPESRRGQLILVGAVVIAAVIIGLTVLINSVLFTETVGSDSMNSRVGEASQSDFEVRKAVRSLLLRVNHGERNVTKDRVQARAARNVLLYSRLIGEVYATARPIGVNATYSNTSTDLGVRIVQSYDGGMNRSDGTATWTPLPGGGTPRDLGWFTMNVNVQNSSKEEEFSIFARETGGSTVTLSFNKTANSTVWINSSGSVTAGESTVCDPSNGRVLVDIYDGTAFTGDCSFVGFEAILDGSNALSKIEFRDGDEQIGQYSMVFNGSLASPSPTLSKCSAGPSMTDPCWTPVVWTANITTHVTGEGLTYSNQYNISIYSRNR